MQDKKYAIISDGSCDLPKELVEELGVTVVPFYVSFDDKTYLREMVDIPVRDFYQQMVDKEGVYPKSSMPSIQDYIDVFKPVVERGEAVICICITTKFSGSYQSAMNAKAMVQEDYPEAEITVINSMVDTVLQGIYVLEAVKLQKQGVSYEDAVKRLDEIRSTGRIFFTVGDFEYLRHGGRIGKLAGVAVSILGIKPLITLKDGEIYSSGITRSRKKSMTMVIDLLLDYLMENGNHIENYHICVGFGYDKAEAEMFRDKLVQTLTEKGFTVPDIHVYQIGATIGVHTGPYPLGIGIIEKA